MASLPALVTAWLLSLDILAGADADMHLATLQSLPGLVTVIGFTRTDADGMWRSQGGSMPGLPLHLRRIGDERRYGISDWPYADGPSALRFDDSGPFGHALRCNRGYLYAEIPREAFAGRALDLHGRCSGTLVAWVKFTGTRHFVAGIWDEGGWDRYTGRRQFALFSGLFGTRSVIAHVSATGAACYPQSHAPGAQYARMRAIDGTDFPNDRWICMAMTWDAGHQVVTAWRDGVASPRVLTDPVAQDALRPTQPISANPFAFPWPIFGPRHFILKFNGYDATSGIAEHWLACDLERRVVTYDHTVTDPALAGGDFLVTVDVVRAGASILSGPRSWVATPGASITLPTEPAPQDGDEIVATLSRDGRQVGSTVRRSLTVGAPFTIGRALGLGSGKEDIDHGSEIAVDAVAVFDRALRAEELQTISLVAGGSTR